MKWAVQHLKISVIHLILENYMVIATEAVKAFYKIQHPDKNSLEVSTRRKLPQPDEGIL